MRALLSWSTGKDCAWALNELRSSRTVEVAGLVTTVNAAFDRVAMHSTRWQVAQAQAASVGLPIHRIDLPWPCSNEDYARIMEAFVTSAAADGIEAMAFGDLFLEDVRRYREERLAGTGIEPLFPLWGRPTRALAAEMIGAGVEAYLTCIDPRRLDRRYAGRKFDAELLASLPADVDPCGENGEFHTCVVAGPMLRSPIDCRVGEVVERDGFVFCDLLPAGPVGGAGIT